MRLASKADGRLLWQLGALYTDEDAAYIEDGSALSPLQRPVSNLFTANVLTTYREKALFGNATWKFTEQFDLALGVRQARNDQHFRQTLGGLLGGDGVQRSTRSSESVTTWSASPRLFLGKDTMAYLRVATGYRAGSPNPVLPAAPEVPAEVKSDTLINYEAGLKTHFWDRRALLEVAAFRID
ncbi:MAG: hypothetical protein GAK31_00353 [Stenotrophomonas maltophilia]|uniref:TonB-dependent receptor-like beta-barrel domain-containing protein n=1 Tax=Stenotrophomonas maltophilia TaxID=40324 RepID=A0A7V8FJD7_STEMA|nr:MAG: hypothetical protein GAK31_00353 [Stenotrophomonas maltophilia]